MCCHCRVCQEEFETFECPVCGEECRLETSICCTNDEMDDGEFECPHCGAKKKYENGALVI